MKIKSDFVSVEKEQELDLASLFDEYKLNAKLKSEADKRCREIKAKIANLFKEQDALGNYWLDTGNGMFKKEIRRSTSIDPIMADPILKRLGFFERVVSYEPVYDLNIINELVSDGSIDAEELPRMFKTEISYAIKAEKAKKKNDEAGEA